MSIVGNSFGMLKEKYDSVAIKLGEWVLLLFFRGLWGC